ncbi:hypothetical protein V4V35_15435 [Bacillus infantis]|uniref:hypothetical protein n=1 Tax=Bacillus infantis TaxID=324767 RepID=UPI002FBDDE8C
MINRLSKTGKTLYFLGMALFAAGFAVNPLLDIGDVPEAVSNLSIPVIIVGLLLIAASNFFKRNH